MWLNLRARVRGSSSYLFALVLIVSHIENGGISTCDRDSNSPLTPALLWVPVCKGSVVDFSQNFCTLVSPGETELSSAEVQLNKG